MSESIAPIILALVVIAFFYLRTSLSSDIAKENIQIGHEFLEVNKSIDGVKETSTGLQYQVLIKGHGKQHPTIRDRVKVHYHGKLLDDTVFDSSIDRNETASFNLKQVISGWREGVQLMVVGEKTRFFIPSKLAYGNQSNGKIKAGSLLIIEVELLSINEDN